MDLEALGLPWRGWIRQRGAWERIVGKGVVAIELRRLADYDNSENHMRTDIVVTRADGMSVRLHPHKRNFPEAIPIEGRLADWLGEDDLAILSDERNPSAASTSVPQRAACLDAATSDDAATAAAAASICVPPRSSDAAAAAAIRSSTKPTLPVHGPCAMDDRRRGESRRRKQNERAAAVARYGREARRSGQLRRGEIRGKRASAAAAACVMTECRSPELPRDDVTALASTASRDQCATYQRGYTKLYSLFINANLSTRSLPMASTMSLSLSY